MDGHADHTHTSVNEQEPSVEESLDRLRQQCGELQAYFSHFMRAQVDALKLSGRHLVIWITVGGLGLIALLTLLIVAVVLLCTGLATGLGLALGNAPWLGQIIVGAGVLAVFTAILLGGCYSLHHRARTRKVEHYAERQLQQQAQFGHSVAERAHHTEI